MLAWSGIQQQPPALRGVSILCEKAIVRCVLYQCHDRACSNYYSLGTQPTSADEPTLFPHVLTDPEARPKTDPGVHKRLQNHGKMLSPEYRRSKSLAGRVPAQECSPKQKQKQGSKKRVQDRDAEKQKGKSTSKNKQTTGSKQGGSKKQRSRQAEKQKQKAEEAKSREADKRKSKSKKRTRPPGKKTQT